MCRQMTLLVLMGELICENGDFYQELTGTPATNRVLNSHVRERRSDPVATFVGGTVR